MVKQECLTLSRPNRGRNAQSSITGAILMVAIGGTFLGAAVVLNVCAAVTNPTVIYVTTRTGTASSRRTVTID